MTILIVLVGLLISHFAAGVRHLRDFTVLLWPMQWIRQRWPDPDWLAMLVVVVTAWLLAWLATALMTSLFGVIGWAVLALVVFVYTLGPRDLEKDLTVLLAGDEGEVDSARFAETMAAMQLKPDDPPAAVAASVYHAALSRWFGLLFWFVLLGIPGAILYRLTRAALQQPLNAAEIDWMARLRMVLDLPVIGLMVLATAMCGDLDRVQRIWREASGTEALWGLTPAILDRIAADLLPEDAGFKEALISGQQMVWRILVLWLVVLSLILLAGWLV